MEKSWWPTKVTAALAVLLLVTMTTAAAEEYRAWTGEFMRMGAGARAMGMGNAYTAVEGDIYSSYFNPAGLAAMRSRQMTFSFRQLTMDRNFRYMALGSPIGPDASFAFSWLNAATDDIIGRDLNGNATGALDDSRNAFTISFAKDISRIVSIGINTKYVLWKLGDDDATSFGFDLGVIVRPIEKLTASLAVRDIRSRFAWKNDSWDETLSGADAQVVEKEDRFPKYYTAGLSYRLFDDKLLLAATAEMVENYPLGIDLGAAYTYRILTLRTGVYSYNSSDELDSGSVTAGLSLAITGSADFDYAFMSDGLDDGTVHIISFVFHHGDY